MTRAFTRNPAFAKELAASGDYRDGMQQITKTFADRVRDEAPTVTGHFRSSISTFNTPTEQGVRSTDIAAHIVEYGSVKNPPYAPFRRGARAAGLRLDTSRQ